MSDGTVKWFNPRKGYGFIATEDGRDVFVHYASISGDGYRTLAEGDPVSFDVVEGEKGLRAENVIAVAASSGNAAPQSDATPESDAAPQSDAVAQDE